MGNCGRNVSGFKLEPKIQKRTHENSIPCYCFCPRAFVQPRQLRLRGGTLRPHEGTREGPDTRGQSREGTDQVPVSDSASVAQGTRRRDGAGASLYASTGVQHSGKEGASLLRSGAGQKAGACAGGDEEDFFASHPSLWRQLQRLWLCLSAAGSCRASARTGPCSAVRRARSGSEDGSVLSVLHFRADRAEKSAGLCAWKVGAPDLQVQLLSHAQASGAVDFLFILL